MAQPKTSNIDKLKFSRQLILEACEKRLDGLNDGRSIVKNFSFLWMTLLFRHGKNAHI